MKDYSVCFTERPFCCNIDGCLKRFTNEDHLTVHKKRHDMILNLGLGSKDSSTFTDETPTPTQFIKNCEEVGLFQDLQNVNLFEETFKNAVEAVKAGQPICLEKSMQTNLSDDTLHTPNIFPNISDMSNIIQCNSTVKSENILIKKESHEKFEVKYNYHVTPGIIGRNNCVESENIPSCKININKSEILPKNLKLETGKDIKYNLNGVYNQKNTTHSLDSVVFDNTNTILNVPKSQILQFITPENYSSSSNVVFMNNLNNSYSNLSMTLSEDCKTNLNENNMNKEFRQKIPISKCPSSKKLSNSLTSKFSKFSENALKLMSKLENSKYENNGNSILTTSKKKKRKNNNKFSSKETRTEFLARCRAASSRCREKKKMYILYLEKVNRELTASNNNLNLINNSLYKHLYNMYKELFKHKNCNAYDDDTEKSLKTMWNIFKEEPFINKEKTIIELEPITEPESPKIHQSDICSSPTYVIPENNNVPLYMKEFENTLSLDVAEVTLNDKIDEIEKPLNEFSKPNIIVRFTSVDNDLPSDFYPDFLLGHSLEIDRREDVRKIFDEHSYILKKPIFDDDRFVKCKSLNENITKQTTDDFEIGLSKNDNNDVNKKNKNGLNDKTLLKQRTPPPLILLKPFKKRSLQNKNIENI